MKKYNYLKVFVDDVDDYIKHIKDGYLIIDIKPELEGELYKKLSLIKDESDELLYTYSRLFYRFSDDPYKGIKVIEIANTLIERNNPLGHYLLASSLYTGVGGKKSFKEGNKHYEIAANMGHAPSMYNLAIAYSRGLEIRKSYRKSFEWMIMAANLDFAIAEYGIAVNYLIGRGTHVSKKKAHYYFLKAAIQEDYNAQYRLAYLYLNGIGTKKNEEQAALWLSRALKNGLPKEKADKLIKKD